MYFKFICLFFVSVGCNSSVQRQDKYLAQEPPTNYPKKFAPGIISMENGYEYGSVFNKDGYEMFFGKVVDGKEEIRYTKFDWTSWTEPMILLNHPKYGYNDPFLSPDENRLYFISRRAKDGLGEPKDFDIWYIERQGDGWSEPINAGPEINSEKNEYYISFTDEGTMYFGSNRNDYNYDIYKSQYSNDTFQKPKRLSGSINTFFYEADAFVDPGEEYLIFSSQRVGGYGGNDLYVSFKEDKGNWGEAINLGSAINTKGTESCPFVTKDGKYFFYTSNKDIYWVNTEIIRQVRDNQKTKPVLNRSYSNIGQEQAKDSLVTLRKHILNGKYPLIDAILVRQNENLIIEEYFDRFDKDSIHEIRSSLKSVTSLLTGIAVDQGLLSVEDHIGKYLTEWENDPRGEIKIKYFLQMRSGIACEEFFSRGPNCENEMWRSEDWLAYNLSVPTHQKPGTTWEYSSLEPDLVGVAIARASNMRLDDFAKKYLFDRLQITDYKWHITPEGRVYAAGSFYMRPRDLIKIAQLVYHKGKYNGEQIVSESWIDASTTCEIPIGMSYVDIGGPVDAESHTARYGYFWYRELLEYNDIKTEVLFSFGNGGQTMMILEDYNATVTFNASSHGTWKALLCFEVLLKYIIPILQENK